MENFFFLFLDLNFKLEDLLLSFLFFLPHGVQVLLNMPLTFWVQFFDILFFINNSFPFSIKTFFELIDLFIQILDFYIFLFDIILSHFYGHLVFGLGRIQLIFELKVLFFQFMGFGIDLSFKKNH